MSDWLDNDGYPTDAALQRLEEWPHADVNGALDFMQSLWHWDDLCRHDLSPAEREVLHADAGDKFLRCATGGWSGNEALIAAFEGKRSGMGGDKWLNSLMRRRVWRLHVRGGLHIYEYLKEAK